MSDEQDVTNGEIYRICLRLEGKVDRINGTVQSHETRLSLLEASDKKSTDVVARWGTLGNLLAGAGYAIGQWWSR